MLLPVDRCRIWRSWPLYEVHKGGTLVPFDQACLKDYVMVIVGAGKTIAARTLIIISYYNIINLYIEKRL